MARNYLTENQYYNYPIDEAQTMFDLQNPDKEFLDFYFSKPLSSKYVDSFCLVISN